MPASNNLRMNRALQLQGLDTAQKCWKLCAEHGMTTTEAATELGITKGAVSKAMRRAEALAMDVLKKKVTEHKAKMLALLERQYLASWESFELSKQGETRKLSRRSARGTDADARNTTEVETTGADGPGDSKFLVVAQKALDAICKLLGLNAPVKVAVVDEDRPLGDVTEDELNAEMASLLRQAGIDPSTLLTATTPKGVM